MGRSGIIMLRIHWRLNIVIIMLNDGNRRVLCTRTFTAHINQIYIFINLVLPKKIT